jgi:hypothetical protein
MSVKTAIVAVATLKTGEQYEYEYRDSWGARYYSFDSGDTWHKSKSAAYRAAEATGKLRKV